MVVLPRRNTNKHYKTVFMKRYISTGLSLPGELLRKIDTERGDIPRSRFLLRLIERAYEDKQTNIEVQL